MRIYALGLAIALSAPAGTAVAEDRDSTSKAGRPDEPGVTVAAVGDILFGRYVRSRKRYKRVSAVDQPFAHVASVLASADIAFGNVETPLMREPNWFRVYKSLTFRAEPSDAEVLADAGFDVVSIANNHTLNLGSRGAPATRKHVQAGGLAPCGAGADVDEAGTPAIVEASGVRVMFLCYTVWTNGRKHEGKHGAVAWVRSTKVDDEMPGIIKAARAEHEPDFTVVSLHWGVEYEPHPSRAQVRAARAMVDAGADLVLGHHPHVVQDIERYKGAVIAYSLGNFLFDNPELRQRRTVILEAEFFGAGEERRVDVTLHPVLIDRDKKKRNRPKLATGKAYRRWARRLKKLARGFAIAPDPAR